MNLWVETREFDEQDEAVEIDETDQWALEWVMTASSKRIPKIFTSLSLSLFWCAHVTANNGWALVSSINSLLFVFLYF